MSYIGADKIGGMHLSSTEIAKAYLGSTLVYQKSGVTPVLPYDAEVEYLKSSGTQYIDTGITIDETTEVEIEVAFNAKNTVGYFGSRFDPLRFNCTTFSSGSQFAFAMTNNSWPNTKTTLELNKFYKLTAKNGSYSVDGTSYSSTYLSSFNLAYNFLLFGCRYGNGSLYNSQMSCKKLVIKKSGVKVLDLIAVRVGTTGYMYDKVSGNLFGNDGTGSFTIGNDIT